MQRFPHRAGLFFCASEGRSGGDVRLTPTALLQVDRRHSSHPDIETPTICSVIKALMAQTYGAGLLFVPSGSCVAHTAVGADHHRRPRMSPPSPFFFHLYNPPPSNVHCPAGFSVLNEPRRMPVHRPPTDTRERSPLSCGNVR